jgi:mRNA-degrading endonuclease RelE of RelBE toxin-antitoxin system
MDNLIHINSRAERELQRFDKTTKAHIVTALLAFIEDPQPPGCLKVRTSEILWRIRVDDWHVGYEINDADQEVTIITIFHRREFYD